MDVLTASVCQFLAQKYQRSGLEFGPGTVQIAGACSYKWTAAYYFSTGSTSLTVSHVVRNTFLPNVEVMKLATRS